MAVYFVSSDESLKPIKNTIKRYKTVNNNMDVMRQSAPNYSL